MNPFTAKNKKCGCKENIYGRGKGRWAILSRSLSGQSTEFLGSGTPCFNVSVLSECLLLDQDSGNKGPQARAGLLLMS